MGHLKTFSLAAALALTTISCATARPDAALPSVSPDQIMLLDPAGDVYHVRGCARVVTGYREARLREVSGKPCTACGAPGYVARSGVTPEYIYIPSSDPKKSVYVEGYRRSDGTWVAAHVRRAPGAGRSARGRRVSSGSPQLSSSRSTSTRSTSSRSGARSSSKASKASKKADKKADKKAAKSASSKKSTKSSSSSRRSGSSRRRN